MKIVPHIRLKRDNSCTSYRRHTKNIPSNREISLRHKKIVTVHWDCIWLRINFPNIRSEYIYFSIFSNIIEDGEKIFS